MADRVIIVDDEGTEHQFPAGFDPKRAAQIVKNQKLTAANERPLQEPTTFGGGFAKGLNDYATELGQSAFEGAAQPRSAGDFLSLIGPSILPMRAAAGMKVIPGASAEPLGNRALRFGARRAADIMDITPNILTNKLEDRAIKGLRSIGEKEPTRFTDLPLTKQQRYLPQTPGPERRSVPPTQAEPTPFHERPLFQQQGNFPERPAPDVRTPMPSHVPQGTMNDLPLYKQQEILEKFGVKPTGESMRAGGPIASGHEVGSSSSVSDLLDRYRPNVSGPQAGGSSIPASPSPLGARVPVEGMVGEGSSAPAASTSPIARSFQEGLRPLIETDEIPHGLVPHSFHQTIGDLNQGMRAGQPGPLDELLLKILREGK